MKFGKTAKALALAVAVGMSSQVMAADTNQWWSFDYEDVASITALTNASYSTVGQWSTVAGDESSIATVTTNITNALKLDTQGNNLTWTPTPLATAVTGTVILVDSAIYLVGSDSAPTGFDADALNPVQTAVYLKNYINSQNVTTSSVLCAYVSTAEGVNSWVELSGHPMIDTNWYNIKIEVAYPGNANPVVSYKVNGHLMSSGVDFDFDIANFNQFTTTAKKKVNSVSFRGTGAVDNFVGAQLIPGAAATLTFVVETFATPSNIVADVTDNVFSVTESPVTPPAQWNVLFNDHSVVEGITNYLALVRVITNGTDYVDYAVTESGGVLTPTSPLYLDGFWGKVRLDVNTTGMTAGYTVKAYYGGAPTGGVTEKTVTFNENGGSGSMTAQSASTLTALTANTFTRTGYAFAGWSTLADGTGTDYADQADYAFTADATLYAQWTIISYTLTFDSAEGSAVSPITQDYNTAVTAPAAPTKTGYTFNGWSPTVPAFMPAESITLTAQWTIKQYTLTFDSAGGSAVSPITQDFNTAVSAPAAPTRLGYAFLAWSPTVPATMPAANSTLTAQWTLTEDMTFDTVGGANLVITSTSFAGSILTVGFGANGAVTEGSPATSTLWIIVSETLNGTVSYVEVEATVTSPGANSIEGTFTIDTSALLGTPATLFVRGIRTTAPVL